MLIHDVSPIDLESTCCTPYSISLHLAKRYVSWVFLTNCWSCCSLAWFAKDIGYVSCDFCATIWIKKEAAPGGDAHWTEDGRSKLAAEIIVTSFRFHVWNILLQYVQRDHTVHLTCCSLCFDLSQYTFLSDWLFLDYDSDFFLFVVKIDLLRSTEWDVGGNIYVEVVVFLSASADCFASADSVFVQWEMMLYATSAHVVADFLVSTDASQH